MRCASQVVPVPPWENKFVKNSNYTSIGLMLFKFDAVQELANESAALASPLDHLKFLGRDGGGH